MLLPTSRVCSGCPRFIHLLYDLLRSPDTRNETMVVVLLVSHGILHSRISDPHEVVQTYHGQHEMFRIVWSLVHCRQETSEVIGKDAECVFNEAPCPRQTVIEDSFIVCHVAARVGFHQPLLQRESVVANHKVVEGVSSLGSAVGGGRPRIPFSSSGWSSDRLKTAQSDVKTSTLRNL